MTFKNLWKKGKGIARHPLALAAMAFALALPARAHADFFDLIQKGAGLALGPLFSSIAVTMFALSWVMSLIAGIFVAIIGWVLQVILAINMDIVNSTPVVTGFPVVLSIANLLFVFGIIIIAIATILRIESYGLKHRLIWLILMAVLVNFGLVISGTILNFSDSFTTYFVQAVSPAGNEGDQTLFSFASTVAGAFQPQANFFFDTMKGKDVGKLEKLKQALGFASGDSQSLVGPIAGVLLSLVSLLIIIIVLGGLVIMLLYRYVKLSLSLVLLPLAWAAFAFPAFKKYFSKWWDSFIKLTFWPPILVFFLWLALKTAEAMGKSQGGFVSDAMKNTDEWNGLERALAGLFTSSIDQLVRTLILGSIVIGGLAAAQGLGAKFADTAMKGVEGAKHFGTKQASKYARRGGAHAAAALKVKDRAEAWAKTPGGFGRGNLLLGKLKSLVGAEVLTWNKGLGKAAIDAEKEKIKKYGLFDLSKLMEGGSLSEEQRIAAFNRFVEEGEVPMLRSINGLSVAEWIAKNENKIAKVYGQAGTMEKLKENTMYTKDMIAALRTASAGGPFNQDDLRNALQGLLKWLKRDEWRNTLKTKGGYQYDVDKKKPRYGWSEEQTRQVSISLLDNVMQVSSAGQVDGALHDLNTNADHIAMMKDLLVTRAEQWATTTGTPYANEEEMITKFLDSNQVNNNFRTVVKKGGKRIEHMGMTIDQLATHIRERGARGRTDVGGWDVADIPPLPPPAP